MPIPMPTVVAKGATALSLDTRYSTPHQRWDSLKALRATFATGNNQTGMDVGQNLGSLTAAEAQHLRNDWFTQGQNQWMVLKPLWNPSPNPHFPDMPMLYFEYSPKQGELTNGERVLTQGLIQALECSLGLGDSTETPPLQRDDAGNVKTDPNGLELVDIPALKRNLTVDVYWVCGKLDGFEVQVSWNENQVTCFILTPQVAEAADVFTGQYTYPDDLVTLKRSNARGMVVTTVKKKDLSGASSSGGTSGDVETETIILARKEGGVNNDPLSRGRRQPLAPTNAPVLPGGTQ